MSHKISFVILNSESENFQSDILKPLNINIIEDESDIALGFYTVCGSSESISELQQYLYNNKHI
jgi:hypothetical protein